SRRREVAAVTRASAFSTRAAWPVSGLANPPATQTRAAVSVASAGSPARSARLLRKPVRGRPVGLAGRPSAVGLCGASGASGAGELLVARDFFGAAGVAGGLGSGR